MISMIVAQIFYANFVPELSDMFGVLLILNGAKTIEGIQLTSYHIKEYIFPLINQEIYNKHISRIKGRSRIITYTPTN